MKKKMIFSTVVALATLSGYMGFNAYSTANETSDLTLANVEAEADFIEYWNRLDYDCTDVTCNCILYTYSSEIAVYVGEGNGSVAHTWSCAGCGDCGWN